MADCRFYISVVRLAALIAATCFTFPVVSIAQNQFSDTNESFSTQAVEIGVTNPGSTLERSDATREINLNLEKAISVGTTSEVEAAINAGADANYSDKYGRTVLMYAAFRGDCYFMALLLERGARINDVDFGGMSALIFAVKQGNAEAVDYLLHKGANVNLRDNFNESALMIARSKKLTEIENILISAGAKD